MRDTRIFFKLGELVQLKQDIPNKPIMMVGKIPKSRRVSGSRKTKDTKKGYSAQKT